MILSLLYTIVASVALWLLLRWFARAKPAKVARMFTYAALGALVLLGVFLVATGRLAGVFAVAAGLAPWIMRAVRLHGMWKAVRAFGIRMKGGQASAGNASRVETRFLAMTLDHDTGALDGEVREGPLAGRRLSSLDRAQALELWRQVQGDVQSVQVLEAWLDRNWPDWRGEAPQGEPAPPPSSAAMTREEAFEVLGLSPGASPADIKAAHRRLMRLAHPDQGGSTWIAARINRARDILLDGR